MECDVTACNVRPGSEVKAMELFQKCFSMSPGLADVFGM